MGTTLTMNREQYKLLSTATIQALSTTEIELENYMAICKQSGDTNESLLNIMIDRLETAQEAYNLIHEVK